MSKKTYAVGISGGTCSDKSTITDRLAKMLSKKYTVSHIF